jgi:hypothetical protein
MLAGILSLFFGSLWGYIGGFGLLAGLAFFGFLLGWGRDLVWLAAAAAAVWLATGTIYREGQAACEDRVAKAVTAERDRLDIANAKADAYQQGVVAGLLRGQQDLAATAKENDDEAVSDPDGDQCGLSLGGVLRYEKLRGGAH